MTSDPIDLSSEREQVLAVFHHAGEEIRFFKSQQWHVTNYALLAYAALVAVPNLVQPPNWSWFVSLFRAGLAWLAAGWAWYICRSLDMALAKERDRMDKARAKLPLIEEIHQRPDPQDDATVSSILQAAILAGAFLVLLINLSRLSAWLASWVA